MFFYATLFSFTLLFGTLFSKSFAQDKTAQDKTTVSIESNAVNKDKNEKMKDDPLNRAKHVLCKLKGDVRTLQQVMTDGVCKVVYTKAGKDSIVANAKSAAYCQKIMNDVRIKLEGADWKCRDISGSTVMKSKDFPSPTDLTVDRLPANAESPVKE